MRSHVACVRGATILAACWLVLGCAPQPVRSEDSPRDAGARGASAGSAAPRGPDGGAPRDPDPSCTAGQVRTCYPGDPATIDRGTCRSGRQRCEAIGPEFGLWGRCEGAITPEPERCADGLDNDCNGHVDDAACEDAGGSGVAGGGSAGSGTGAGGGESGGASGGAGAGGAVFDPAGGGVGVAGAGGRVVVDVAVDIDGDCVTASCPGEAPHPVGCSIEMIGNDPRGCIASTPASPVVYFQEGNDCGLGRVTGILRCSNQPDAPLGEANCAINKSVRYYPTDPSGCP